ncbi:hypothetical protein CANMA_004597 [Candida margitis]|uniref:uncharacterized protein n=1 Tax=Candida margitis TaxID=1775924 RepID=UPI0022277EAB|nr:uncharacterized protein CANMA_004597 [Candida margitis]KAI5955417.1 hypothetical protein CANMA_004597 [Candida margitis]
MPPQITFINLAKEVAIPIKIFIKNIPLDSTTSNTGLGEGTLGNCQSDNLDTGTGTRSSTIAASTSTTTSLSINEKSPITIHNINQIKLNQHQIKTLIDTISPRIKNILYYNLRRFHHQRTGTNESMEADNNEQDLGVYDDAAFQFKNIEDYYKTTTFTINSHYKVTIPVDVLYQVRYKLGLLDYDEARRHLRDCGFNLVVKQPIHHHHHHHHQQQRRRNVGSSSTNTEQSRHQNESMIERGDNDNVDKEQKEIEENDDDDDDGVEQVKIKQEKTDDDYINDQSLFASFDQEEGEKNKANDAASKNSGYVFQGKSIIGDFATCIKVYVY